MKKLVLAIFVILTAVACNGGGGGYGGGYVDKADAFVNLLNNQYYGDSTYILAKHPNQTLTEDFVVVWSADTGYIAYDVANYLPGDSWYTYSNYAEFQEVYIHYYETDSYTGEVYYYGDAFYNDYYGSYAGEFVFEETEAQGKDLEKLAAFKEAHKVGKIAKALTSEFGLSEERGLKVAKLVGEWEKLSKSRALTDADAHAFSKELLGVDMAQASEAFKQKIEGDDSLYEDLLSKAAEANGTSPEHMNQIVGGLLQ